ncbi:MAG TPA: DUF1707 domain-containing protein [Streptosporangiaceae bacterium]|nr:DUF1707 domain-containing protein [Streptosporangiaceae bacterium]
MSPENPNDISRLRISDADRDRAASLLSNALAEGRLTPQEHSERLDAIYAAKVHGDIAPIVSDLPGASAAIAAQNSVGAVEPRGKRWRLVALLGGISRKGRWQVPADMEAITVIGGAEFDLRQAILPPGEARMRTICFLGGVEITVPPEVHVIDDGWAILGGREIPPDTPESARPDAPVLRLTGITILGGISVKRRARDFELPSERRPLDG